MSLRPHLAICNEFMDEESEEEEECDDTDDDAESDEVDDGAELKTSGNGE